MKFPKGNKVVYGQDFGWYRGVPSDVDFEVENISGDDGGLMWLVADGYGKMKGGNYGNGSICVYLKTDFKPELKIKIPKDIIKEKLIEKLGEIIEFLKEK